MPRAKSTIIVGEDTPVLLENDTNSVHLEVHDNHPFGLVIELDNGLWWHLVFNKVTKRIKLIVNDKKPSEPSPPPGTTKKSWQETLEAVDSCYKTLAIKKRRY